MNFINTIKAKIRSGGDEDGIKKRNLKGKYGLLVSIFAVAMSLFQLYTAAAGLLPPLQQRSIHLFFVLALVFLIFPARSKSPLDRPSILDWLMIVFSASGTLYAFFRYLPLAKSGAIYITSDYIFGFITILMVFEAARRVVGIPLTLLSGICMIYAFVGPWIPGPLGHSGFSVTRVIEQMYLTTEGILDRFSEFQQRISFCLSFSVHFSV